MTSNFGEFAAIVRSTLENDLGWSLGGRVSFVAVEADADVRILLASPAAVDRAARVCSDQYSCRVGRDVLINDHNWRHATPAWPGSLHEYRHMVINHEVGHWLGFHHRDCPAPGWLAPVMQQQSIEVAPCRSNHLPLPSERLALADSLGVRLADTRAVAIHSGQVLDVTGASHDPGAHVIQWPWNGGPNQRWSFEPLGDGTYRIVAGHSGQVLDVAGISHDPGAHVIQWPWNGGPNQRWRVEDVDGPGWRIAVVHSGQVLDVAGISHDPGARVIQWPWNGGPNQRWEREGA